jgi:acyl dehydratase
MTQETEKRYGRITEEAVAELRARIGRWRDVTQPYNSEVTADGIRHYMRAVGDVNEFWDGDEDAWGGPVAPPGFLYSVHWGAWDFRRGRGLPGVHGLHAGDKWHYFKPLHVGTKLRATHKLIGLDEKQGKFAGRSFLQRDVVAVEDETGDLVALCYMSSMRVDRDEGRSRGKYKETAVPHYSPEALASIESDYDNEAIRGTEQRLWEDVKEGDRIGPIVMGPYTASDCIGWVMGVGSPHIRVGKYWLDYRRRTPPVAVNNPETGVPEPVERVHWDNFMATEIGMPAAYDYGSHRGAISTRLMTDWAGDTGFVKMVDARYRGMVFLGDTLWFEGTVERKFQTADNSFVECEIYARNQRDEKPLTGRAIVALPSRERGVVRTPVRLADNPDDSDPREQAS